jgi:hypothetical protein
MAHDAAHDAAKDTLKFSNFFWWQVHAINSWFCMFRADLWVVVYTLNDFLTDLQRRLHNLQSSCPGACVLLVGTMLDQKPLDDGGAPLLALRKNFPELMVMTPTHGSITFFFL